MTGSQGLVAFIVGPTLGVVIAMLLGKTGAAPVIFAALIGEGGTIVALQLWSHGNLRQGAPGAQDRLVAVSANVSLGNRLTTLGVLALLALAVAGVGLLLHRLVVGRAS